MIRANFRKFAVQSRRQTTQAASNAISENTLFPNAALPAKYVLTTIRSFPSLEPISFAPIPSSVLNAPLRRDILWSAVVYENDNKRVGSSNPPGRSENGYSRRKLAPQKGTGRARVGDANSPTRHNGARALARSAPNDYTTKLTNKLYNQAILNALSHQYRSNNLFVIGGGNTLASTNDLDLNELEVTQSNLDTDDSEIIFERFLEEYKLRGKKLLFITDSPRPNLMAVTDKYKNQIDLVQKEFIDVNDLLRAKKIFIDLKALEFLSVTHSPN
ncbi:hypothetical protein TPHA_0D02610 [Tetrapisispora phaffii CBS 4417]|uniref:Large ribosomal subunit protein uL4m n=1 Tax=Tetrapisispora phaffii (strain ATCC 24235 / CBS 4417 / NBRC 1672 / NRRL Y-8282 / UCD 70-5) TaxID=1071381 RepID=G8BSS7_TETPH|nr:mitochondrial 54S ribosomal protein YmL6 TPHA_0D02610 [Tetrapisispora phaffii CBS 4417]CCE62898.1 hypothetical protein TPHA_0D02610 [Tetrapisispora phaffii CBS 4417]